MSKTPLPPRLKPLAQRKNSVLAVLDIGTSKTVCLIVRCAPALAGEAAMQRSRVLGIGHQRSSGMKSGAVVNLEAVENSIRLAVDAAERMARVQLESVIINVSGGRLSSQRLHGDTQLSLQTVTDADLHRVLEGAMSRAQLQGRMLLHSIPSGFALDSAKDIRDPKGMVGQRLGADLHIVDSELATVRNLMLAVERCHLRVEAVVASPYATGLASVVEDEAELGAVVVDFGAGTTTIGVFANGYLQFADALAVGGHHVTMDIARGLNCSLAEAERLKTAYGSCLSSPSDEQEQIKMVRIGDEASQAILVPKSFLVRIIRPRVEEILELIRDRLKQAGFSGQAGRRLILSGGACQLTGMVESAKQIISPQVRFGRPLAMHGLPESAKSPAFATAVGLCVYPQVAGIEVFELRGLRQGAQVRGGGYMARVGRWLKESF